MCFSKLSFSVASMAALSLCVFAPAVHAQQYLVGANLFSANANGSTASGQYQYDTDNLATSSSPLNINNAPKSIAFALVNGSNSFTFNQGLGNSLSSVGGTVGDLGLFFSASNTPYNPSPGTARTPDLLIARLSSGAASFFTPTAGTAINNYAYPGSSLANGASSFTLGTSTITVSAYSVTDAPNGTFTLLVTPAAVTPEPGSVALLIGIATTGAGFLSRRRRKQATSVA